MIWVARGPQVGQRQLSARCARMFITTAFGQVLIP